MHAIILAGGKGKRLWPKTDCTSKPFIRLHNGDSLLQSAIKRVSKISEIKYLTIILDVKNYELAVQHLEQIQEENLDIEIDFIAEPFSRDTAPACCLGALNAKDQNMLLIPVDQLIEDSQELIKAISLGNYLANKNFISLFGIKPSFPSSDYGYITFSNKGIVEFKEKPDKELAIKYYNSGRYFWNAGILLCNSQLMLNNIKQHAPEVYNNTLKAFESRSRIQNAKYQSMLINSEYFIKNKAISIDFLVLEKVKNLKLIPCNVKWKDLGTWHELSQAFPKDLNNNSLIGRIKTYDTKNCYIENSSENLITIGVSDLIIVNTPSGILIANKNQSEKMKHLKFHESFESLEVAK